MENSKKEILAIIHKSLDNGIRNSKSDAPRSWLKKRNLTIESSGALFNSGQIHQRKSEAFKIVLESVGFLKRKHCLGKNGQIQYTCMGKYSVIFPLKDECGDVVNFNAVLIKNNDSSYLNNEGIYPSYPNKGTKKLFIVNSSIEAATILEANVLDNREAVIALFHGEIMPQHKEAIKLLSQLEEVIWIN